MPKTCNKELRKLVLQELIDDGGWLTIRNLQNRLDDYVLPETRHRSDGGIFAKVIYHLRDKYPIRRRRNSKGDWKYRYNGAREST
jgi:hypothetical protein